MCKCHEKETCYMGVREKCSECDKVTKRCRCPREHAITYVVCPDCSQKAQAPADEPTPTQLAEERMDDEGAAQQPEAMGGEAGVHAEPGTTFIRLSPEEMERLIDLPAPKFGEGFDYRTAPPNEVRAYAAGLAAGVVLTSDSLAHYIERASGFINVQHAAFNEELAAIAKEGEDHAAV